MFEVISWESWMQCMYVVVGTTTTHYDPWQVTKWSTRTNPTCSELTFYHFYFNLWLWHCSFSRHVVKSDSWRQVGIACWGYTIHGESLRPKNCLGQHARWSGPAGTMKDHHHHHRLYSILTIWLPNKCFLTVIWHQINLLHFVTSHQIS